MKTFVVFVTVVALGALYWWWPWGRPTLDYLFPSKEGKTLEAHFRIELEQGQREMKLGDMTDFQWDRVCWWDGGEAVNGADPLWVLGVNAFTIGRTVYAKEGITTLVFQHNDMSLSPMYLDKRVYHLEGGIVLADPQSGLRRPCYEHSENPVLLVQENTRSEDGY